MFKSVPNAKGCILNNISSMDNVLEIDADSYAALSAVLGEGGSDHTYIRMNTAPACEHIKVQQLNSGFITVGRARDNTVALAFPAMTEFEYVMGQAAVQEMISDVVASPSLSIVGIDPIVVTQLSADSFEISVPEPTFTSSGNTVDVTGTFPNYDVNVVRGTNGCCD